jgi:hypothetical protein
MLLLLWCCQPDGDAVTCSALMLARLTPNHRVAGISCCCSTATTAPICQLPPSLLLWQLPLLWSCWLHMQPLHCLHPDLSSAASRAALAGEAAAGYTCTASCSLCCQQPSPRTWLARPLLATHALPAAFSVASNHALAPGWRTRCWLHMHCQLLSLLPAVKPSAPGWRGR